MWAIELRDASAADKSHPFRNPFSGWYISRNFFFFLTKIFPDKNAGSKLILFFFYLISFYFWKVLEEYKGKIEVVVVVAVGKNGKGWWNSDEESDGKEEEKVE